MTVSLPAERRCRGRARSLAECLVPPWEEARLELAPEIVGSRCGLYFFRRGQDADGYGENALMRRIPRKRPLWRQIQREKLHHVGGALQLLLHAFERAPAFQALHQVAYPLRIGAVTTP